MNKNSEKRKWKINRNLSVCCWFQKLTREYADKVEIDVDGDRDQLGVDQGDVDPGVVE